MSGESINVRSAYVTVQAAIAVGDNSISTGANTNILTAHGAAIADYVLLDFKLLSSVTVPVLNGRVKLFKRHAGTQPVPTLTYQETFIGSFVLAASLGEYFIMGVVNDDPNDTYYIENDSGGALTLELLARGRAYKAAV